MPDKKYKSKQDPIPRISDVITPEDTIELILLLSLLNSATYLIIAAGIPIPAKTSAIPYIVKVMR